MSRRNIDGKGPVNFVNGHVAHSKDAVFLPAVVQVYVLYAVDVALCRLLLGPATQEKV
jgi:hypothetical protein